MSDHYRQGYGGGRSEAIRQRLQEEGTFHPQSRIPRPGTNNPDRMRGPPSMAPNFSSASPMRSPRRVPAFPAGQLFYHLPDEYEEDYSQIDQWPLQGQYPAHSTRDGNNSPRMAPRRPARPEEPSQRLNYPQYGGEPARQVPRMVPTSRQLHHDQPPSRYGFQQTAGEMRRWTPTPPDFELPETPHLDRFFGPPSTSHEDLTARPSYPSPQLPQQVASRQPENRRPPLGPPPSARRGPMPSSYYPQVGPVHPIAEETDSLRGSARTGSINTGGHDSKTSFASSNAIPIGISQKHLERGREATYPPVRRSAPLSDTESENYDDSPTEPAIARGKTGTPDYTQHREQPSPEHAIVRQASLGKRSKPTLTTVKSSDQARKNSGEAKGAVASLPSQQHNALRDVATADIQRAAKARALTREMLEGHDYTSESHMTERERLSCEQVQPGASSARVQQGSHRDQQLPSSTVATAHMQEGRYRGLSNQSDTSFVTNPYSSRAPQTGKQKPEEGFRSGTGRLDPSSEFDDSTEMRRHRLEDLLKADILGLPHPQHPRPRLPLASIGDPRVESIIGGLEKGGALSAEEAQELKQPMGGLSGRAGRRRPPCLNVNAVKDAEARGSLTSLPDLIRRATKLASNLDRGKTASRMGMDWTDGAGADWKKHRSGSMSDILAAFPPPAIATPPGSRNAIRRSLAGLSFGDNRHSALASDSDTGAVKRRRCCGMPLGMLIGLLLLLFLVVATAIIVPVMLVVIPKQAHSGSTKVGSCAANLTCNNSGTNILGSNGSCECLCVNGYTGATCSTYQQFGCTSISVEPFGNATIGESLPRLLAGAGSSFSIPLDTHELLGLISRLDINCNVQNQLVTFRGQSMKRSLVPNSEKVGGEDPRVIMIRQDANTTTPSTTSDGIVFASGTPTITSTAVPSAATVSILDFARIAVLYVLQTSQTLQTAMDAQDNLQAYFQYGAALVGQTTSASNTTLGNGYTANLVSFSLTTDNGTTVGGK